MERVAERSEYRVDGAAEHFNLGKNTYRFRLPAVRLAAEPLDGQVPRLRHLG